MVVSCVEDQDKNKIEGDHCHQCGNNDPQNFSPCACSDVVDPSTIYVYVSCDNCSALNRLIA